MKMHTDNYAILVSTSKYFFNYRHVTNVLSLYQYLVGKGGFTDENVILMIADDLGASPRNSLPNQFYNSRYMGALEKSKDVDLYMNARVDYKGDDVNVENFLNVLTGQHFSGEIANHRALNLDSNSNVLIYMAGHGGDGFLKFRDTEEMSSEQLAASIQTMYHAGRYKELLFIVDTCEAFTLFKNMNQLPNVFGIGSSLVKEKAYAYEADDKLGVSVSDRFTKSMMSYLIKNVGSSHTRKTASMRRLSDLVASFSSTHLKSHVGAMTGDANERQLADVPLSDFFHRVKRKRTFDVVSDDAFKELIEQLPTTTIDELGNDIIKKNKTQSISFTPQEAFLPKRMITNNMKRKSSGSHPEGHLDPGVFIGHVLFIFLFISAKWISIRRHKIS